MASSNDIGRSALHHPFNAPVIGLTDSLDDDSSPTKHSSKNASTTGPDRDASRLNREGQHSDEPADDGDDAWDDEDDGKENSDDDDNLSLYENWLDGSEKNWKLDQGRLQRSLVTNSQL